MEGESSDCFVAMLGVNSILTMFEEDGGRWVWKMVETKCDDQVVMKNVYKIPTLIFFKGRILQRSWMCHCKGSEFKKKSWYWNNRSPFEKTYCLWEVLYGQSFQWYDHWNPRFLYDWRWSLYRSNRPEVFCKKCVLRSFAKFTRKHLCQSLFFNKVTGLGLLRKF